MYRRRMLNHRADIRSQVWKACGGACHHCGKALDPFLDFHLDHYIPLARGGQDAIENLVGSCKACNIARGGRGDEPKKIQPAKAKAPPQPKSERRYTPSGVFVNGYEVWLLRAKHGWTQEDLAEKAGVSRGFIWRLERKPTRHVEVRVFQVAMALGVDIADIVRAGDGAGVAGEDVMPHASDTATRGIAAIMGL